MTELLAALLLLAGGAFFLAGTVGLLRFPDVYCRLHAIAKADNLGLGFIAAGLALEAESLVLACKLLLVWPLALIASASVSYAVAARARTLEGAPAATPEDP